MRHEVVSVVRRVRGLASAVNRFPKRGTEDFAGLAEALAGEAQDGRTVDESIGVTSRDDAEEVLGGLQGYGLYAHWSKRRTAGLIWCPKVESIKSVLDHVFGHYAQHRGAGYAGGMEDGLADSVFLRARPPRQRIYPTSRWFSGRGLINPASYS